MRNDLPPGFPKKMPKKFKMTRQNLPEAGLRSPAPAASSSWEPVQDRLGFAAGPGPAPRPGHVEPALAVVEKLVSLLALERPLVFLDFEATGLDVGNDRIVELTLVRVEPGGASDWLDTLVQPGVPIPPQATAIHRITDADVAPAPTFAEIAPRLLRTLRGADLCGFNLARYDLPLLDAELERSGLSRGGSARIVDVCVIFKRMERRDLTAAHRFYCGGEPVAAHSASGDVATTMAVFAAQLERYPDLPGDVAGLEEFTASRRSAPVPPPEPSR